MTRRHAVGQLAETLRYKPADRGFHSEGVIRIFHCCNPSGRITALWSTQRLTEMISRSISFGIKTTGA